MAHDRVVQQVMVWFVSPSGMLENVDGRMEFWSGSVDATEAKKVEGASITALLIPSLLHSPVGWLLTTGCRHDQRLILSPSRRTASNLFNSGLSLQVDVLRVYNNFGMLEQFQRRLRASWA